MTIYEKVAKIQDELQVVKKDSKNPHFQNTYATYEQVIETVYPLLRRHKLVALHKLMPPVHDGYIGVATTIRDMDGEEAINSQFDIPFTKKDPQAAGSAITYAKRYSLLAMLGLGTEDDDAEAATTQTSFNQDDAYERSMSKQKVCKDCGSPLTKYKSGTIGCSKYCWRNK